MSPITYCDKATSTVSAPSQIIVANVVVYMLVDLLEIHDDSWFEGLLQNAHKATAKWAEPYPQSLDCLARVALASLVV